MYKSENPAKIRDKLAGAIFYPVVWLLEINCSILKLTPETENLGNLCPIHYFPYYWVAVFHSVRILN